MPADPLIQNRFDPEQITRLERGQYTMLLHEGLSQPTESIIYFSLPEQEDYLYEYEGDLEESLEDLPEIYAFAAETNQAEKPPISLTPEAIVVVGQLWDYFDRTGEQELEGEHDYDFQVKGDRLVVLPKDGSDRVVGIDLDGRVESTFEPERFGHLMERFAIAYQQIQPTQAQQQENQGWERE
jgi:hypothetical protein